jgi:hypothetical protein
MGSHLLFFFYNDQHFFPWMFDLCCTKKPSIYLSTDYWFLALQLLEVLLFAQ